MTDSRQLCLDSPAHTPPPDWAGLAGKRDPAKCLAVLPCHPRSLAEWVA